MRVLFFNDWKKEDMMLALRCMHIIPAIGVSLHRNWKFESVRISWLGFMVGFIKRN